MMTNPVSTNGVKTVTAQDIPVTTGRFTISKSFGFSASHELRLLPKTHKCSRNHGHNYDVTLLLTADQLDRFGFVTDFGDLAPFGDYLRTALDHRLLNDLIAIHPTSELLAWHLGQWFIDNVEPNVHGSLVSVEVSETESSSALWERTDG
ncbi:MAG: 6-pyruvoyl trahydropterin synthase family protein [Pseudonocardia sp.]